MRYPYRCWYGPNGEVRVTTFLYEETRERDCALLSLERYPGWTWEDMTEAQYRAMQPAKHDANGAAQRHKWRKNPNGPGFIVDPTAPDPPHRHQALLDEVQAATTVDELKALLVKYITR